MDWIEGLGTVKKVQENILDVSEDGEETTEHVLTLVFKDLSRAEYLRFVRALKLEQHVAVTAAFTQAEMQMDPIDRQVSQAMEPQSLTTASGFNVGDTVRIIATGETGEVKRILVGGSGPEFWVPTDGEPSKEYSANELEALLFKHWMSRKTERRPEGIVNAPIDQEPEANQESLASSEDDTSDDAASDEWPPADPEPDFECCVEVQNGTGVEETLDSHAGFEIGDQVVVKGTGEPGTLSSIKVLEGGDVYFYVDTGLIVERLSYNQITSVVAGF